LTMHVHRRVRSRPTSRATSGGREGRGHGAPGEADSSTQELAAWVEHATAPKIPSARHPRSCGGFERYAVALALEELDRAPRDALAVLPIAVIGPKLSIDRVIREDMVGRA